MNLSSNLMAASKETPVPGGFRRVTPLPPATAAIRLREQLIAAAFGRPDHVTRGLEALNRWSSLVPLLAGRWFGDLTTAPARGRWIIEKRLSILGTPASPVAQAFAAEVGTALKVTGIVRRMPARNDPSGSHIGVVWKNSTREGANVRQFIEEGRDFLLVDPDADPDVNLPVMARGGQLVGSPGGARVVDGDAVTVLGFVDRVVDADIAGFARPSERGQPMRVPPLRTVLRSADDLGLLIWKAP